MKKRKILAALDVTCAVCGAKPDERCTSVPRPRYAHHTERVWDAQDAQHAIEVLTQ